MEGQIVNDVSFPLSEILPKLSYVATQYMYTYAYTCMCVFVYNTHACVGVWDKSCMKQYSWAVSSAISFLVLFHFSKCCLWLSSPPTTCFYYFIAVCPLNIATLELFDLLPSDKCSLSASGVDLRVRKCISGQVIILTLWALTLKISTEVQRTLEPGAWVPLGTCYFSSLG